MQYIQKILPSLLNLLQCNDKQIRADSCWALSYITDGPNERIQMILDVSCFSLLTFEMLKIREGTKRNFFRAILLVSLSTCSVRHKMLSF